MRDKTPTTTKPSSVPSNGNGHARKEPTPAPESVAPPEFFAADRADALEMLVLMEREGRLRAEAGALEGAKRGLVAKLSAKYGVDITQYTIDSETGVAKRNGTVGEPPPAAAVPVAEAKGNA